MGQRDESTVPMPRALSVAGVSLFPVGSTLHLVEARAKGQSESTSTLVTKLPSTKHEQFGCFAARRWGFRSHASGQFDKETALRARSTSSAPDEFSLCLSRALAAVLEPEVHLALSHAKILRELFAPVHVYGFRRAQRDTSRASALDGSVCHQWSGHPQHPQALFVQILVLCLQARLGTVSTMNGNMNGRKKPTYARTIRRAWATTMSLANQPQVGKGAHRHN